MTHSSGFIVLAVTKIGEKSLVLHTLSAEWGRRSFITSVSRSSGMALFLPMNVLDAEITENSKSDLWRLRNISAVYPLNGIRNEVGKNSITMFMSEVLFRTIREGAYEEGLFEWCTKSVLTLDSLESDYQNFHLRWLLELAGALGFSPTADDIAPFAGHRLADIRRLLSAGFGEFLLIRLSGAVRNEIAGILLDYIAFHTESKIEVRSLKVLRELFA